MKALKKICTALMLLAFAFVFASCSSGSDSDDDDDSPSSVGENVLAGNSYRYSKSDDDKTKTATYAFKDDTVTVTKVEQPKGESAETEITEYKYTYNANTGLLFMNVISWTSDDVKMTSMDDVYKYFAKVESCTPEDIKEDFGDWDMFAENISMCYFVKDNGNILLGEYFDDDEDVENSKFNYDKDGSRVRFKDGEVIELNDVEYDIEVDTKTKTFSPEEDKDGKNAEGSYTVKKATKTLKQLCESNSNYNSNEANGYITITFSKLPSKMQVAPYNMTTGTEYKFIFDLDCDEYIKQ